MTVRQWLNESVEYYRGRADREKERALYNVSLSIANTFLLALRLLPAAALDMEMEDDHAQ